MADQPEQKFHPKIPKIAACEPVKVTLEKGVYFWCACGHSRKQPFCDGNHKHTEITPKRFVIEEPQEVYLCQCKRTRNPPYCDGSHVKAAAELAQAAAKPGAPLGATGKK